MIYIVNHIPNIPLVMLGYENLYVGSVGKGEINHLNPYINEATGLYEIWKKKDMIKGLVHYRRYFLDDGGFLSIDRAAEILSEYDVITCKNYEPPTPLEHLYKYLDKGIVDKYIYQLPREVIEWFNSYQSFNILNMFVSKAEFIDAYCKWLFPLILPLAEQFAREDVTEDRHRNRTIGYIIECLFGYWCKDYKKYQMEVRTL